MLLKSPLYMLSASCVRHKGDLIPLLHPTPIFPVSHAYPQIAGLTERVLRQLATLRSRLINPDYGQPAMTEEGVEKSFTVSGYYGKVYLCPYHISYCIAYCNMTLLSPLQTPVSCTTLSSTETGPSCPHSLPPLGPSAPIFRSCSPAPYSLL